MTFLTVNTHYISFIYLCIFCMKSAKMPCLLSVVLLIVCFTHLSKHGFKLACLSKDEFCFPFQPVYLMTLKDQKAHMTLLKGQLFSAYTGCSGKIVFFS